MVGGVGGVDGLDGVGGGGRRWSEVGTGVRWGGVRGDGGGWYGGGQVGM